MLGGPRSPTSPAYPIAQTRAALTALAEQLSTEVWKHPGRTQAARNIPGIYSAGKVLLGGGDC